jgi:hypothetical protein
MISIRACSHSGPVIEPVRSGPGGGLMSSVVRVRHLTFVQIALKELPPMTTVSGLSGLRSPLAQGRVGSPLTKNPGCEPTAATGRTLNLC